ncbi:MAG: S9 family peptidase [Burkholderiales bacterium]|nr:S9 family peptidase [Burkholderiales bacterium]
MTTEGPAPIRFTPEDIFLEQRITDLDLAPDGAQAVIELKSIDRDKDEYLSHLWLVAMDGGEPRQLTRGSGRDTVPRWSPDGRLIAFLSDRGSEQPQLHLISPAGGEARQLTRFKCSVVDFAWRPGGRHIAAVCAVHVDPLRRGADTGEPDLQRAARSSKDPELVWRLPYKSDGQGYTLGTRLHVALVDVGSGEATMLTRGDFDVSKIAWSPDGASLVFSCSREDPHESYCNDLWCLAVGQDAAAGERQSWRCQVASASWPAWSPDGRWVAFAGAQDGGDSVMRLWLRDVASGELRALGDASIEVVQNPLQWSADSRRIAFIQARRGGQRIAAFDIGAGSPERLVDPPRGQVAMMAARERIVYAEEGVDHPIELHVTDWTGAEPRRLTDFNAWWRERTPLRVERRGFDAPDGKGRIERVEGWVVLPPGRRSRLPLLVDVHGGPASYVSLQFATAPYWQILASRGWAILAIDAVGSSSYGREFIERLNGRWGDLDLPQHLAAAEALRREDLVDDRAAIAGTSYGGFMAAWAIGTCKDFRTATVSAPVANLESHFGSSDSGYYADPYSMDGKPEANRQRMLRLSPMAHIEQACAPVLLLQGKDDQRCPVAQSEELFVKLQRSGTPAEMVLYPGGSHRLIGQGKPSHRLDAIQRIVDWLERWIDIPLRPPQDARGESRGGQGTRPTSPERKSRWTPS